MGSQFMITTGRFLFRYRSLLFPLIFISILFIFRPHPYGGPGLYGLVIWLGFFMTILGETVRVLTIGLDYIERGGKGGSPYASRLVTRGIYSRVRNPMYVGNLLIAFGIGLYSGAPWVLVTVLPFFVFAYFAMIAAEESFLRDRFGDEFENYCRKVNRFWPAWRDMKSAFSGFRFNWRRALAKDNGTAFYQLVALALIPVWRKHFLGDATGFAHYQPFATAIASVLVVSYATVRALVKSGFLSS